MAMHDVRARQFPLYTDFMHSLPPTSTAPSSAQLPVGYSAPPPPPQLAAPQSYRYTSHDSDFVGGPLGPGGSAGPGEYRMYPPSPPYYPPQQQQQAPQQAAPGSLQQQQPPLRSLSLAHHHLPNATNTNQQLYPSYPRDPAVQVPPVNVPMVAPAGPGAASSGPSGPSGIDNNSPPRMMMNGFPPTMPFTRVPSPFSHNHQPLTSMRRAEQMNGVRKSAKRAHNCMVCGKVFARPSALQTHFYSHTGEKPFKCEHAGCGRSFSVVSNLRRHNQKVHDEKRH